MPFFSGLTARVVMAGLALVIAFLAGVHWESKKTAKAAAAFEAYKSQVAGAAAERKAADARQALADLKAKERADENQNRRAARQRDRIVELRVDTDHRYEPAPAAAPSAVCPEGLACFDRDAFERARRDLVEGLRRLADEGTAVENALRTAREWADGD